LPVALVAFNIAVELPLEVAAPLMTSIQSCCDLEQAIAWQVVAQGRSDGLSERQLRTKPYLLG